MKKPHVGIDLMGGDLSPSMLLEALSPLIDRSGTPLHLSFFGTRDIFTRLSFSHPDITYTFIEAEEVIAMNDDPLSAIRLKKKASIPLGIRALKEKELDAFVSLGNTGALFSCAQLLLGNIDGVQRAALLALVPTQKGTMAVLDVGANISNNTEQLVQFAKMGAAYQKSCGLKSPRIGLLNIGTEENKGTEELRKTYRKLKEDLKESFSGNVEAREAFLGNVDVLISDGFTGNIFLKTLEGASQLLLKRVSQAIAHSALDSLQKELDYTEYPGAVLCGVDGIVVKCHGNANAKALFNGIKKAIELIQGGFLDKIKQQLCETLDS